MNQGYNVYKTANVETADKGKLIIICYDVAIKHGNIALDMEPHADLEAWVKHIYKMQDAINELLSALNMDVGEISTNLFRLYEYMLHKLTESVVQVDKGHVKEVMGYLDELRGAWKVAVQNVKLGRGGPTAQPQERKATLSING